MVRWLRLLSCTLLAWLPGALLAATPSRVVSVVPHLTELLYDIGAGDRLVAVDDASDYPTEVKTKPKVANYRSINVEALLAQKPDLILGWRSAQSRMLAPLEQLGIPVFYSEPTDFASLAVEMRALGKLLGVEKSANEAADRYLARLHDLQQRYGQPTGVKVFYQLWYPPLTSVSGNAWPAQAIELCGGINVMANAKTPYPQVDMEQVIRANPALILAGSQDPDALRHWQKWPNLDAVEHRRLDLINSDELHRFTPRALNAVEQVCRAIAQRDSK
ncbi:ABC transporter substrate-binding protein [Aeromonas allosaccharophila]|uniref:cobalamin-binding protein n=1 Tax=Aeromonas allosaccharophila TaxID=656 RepID=UPI000717E311|nr:cobalamin-binding protein [Aeromonas allosaccharophila]KRW64371.1 ABC transporter substrate-binding protein [Aeromonas allosaccharophila]